MTCRMSHRAVNAFRIAAMTEKPGFFQGLCTDWSSNAAVLDFIVVS
ncbi:hypothetical protein [Leptolyngbya sp. CCY15150]|nr:hypothetical protein [Leptolyngbya sp. CCY15150]